jgi:hypothetical protein
MSASQHTRELGGGPIFGAAFHTIHNSIAERALVGETAEKERPELPAIRGCCGEKQDADMRSVGGEGGGGSALMLTCADELVKQAISGPHTRAPRCCFLALLVSFTASFPTSFAATNIRTSYASTQHQQHNRRYPQRHALWGGGRRASRRDHQRCQRRDPQRRRRYATESERAAWIPGSRRLRPR